MSLMQVFFFIQREKSQIVLYCLHSMYTLAIHLIHCHGNSCFFPCLCWLCSSLFACDEKWSWRTHEQISCTKRENVCAGGWLCQKTSLQTINLSVLKRKPKNLPHSCRTATMFSKIWSMKLLEFHSQFSIDLWCLENIFWEIWSTLINIWNIGHEFCADKTRAGENILAIESKVTLDLSWVCCVCIVIRLLSH